MPAFPIGEAELVGALGDFVGERGEVVADVVGVFSQFGRDLVDGMGCGRFRASVGIVGWGCEAMVVADIVENVEGGSFADGLECEGADAIVGPAPGWSVAEGGQLVILGAGGGSELAELVEFFLSEAFAVAEAMAQFALLAGEALFELGDGFGADAEFCGEILLFFAVMDAHQDFVVALPGDFAFWGSCGLSGTLGFHVRGIGFGDGGLRVPQDGAWWRAFSGSDFKG